MVHAYVDFYEYHCGLNLHLFDMKFNARDRVCKQHMFCTNMCINKVHLIHVFHFRSILKFEILHFHVLVYIALGEN